MPAEAPVRYTGEVQALLLDLDDTLLDYSGGVDASWAAACEAGCADRPVDVEALVGAVARARRWFWDDPLRHRQERTNMLRAWQRIVAHAIEALGCPNDGLDAAVAVHYAALRREAMCLFPETRETLEDLCRRGLPLGLVTNGDATQQRDKIERHDLARFFDVVVIEGEFGAGKPDESVYRHALEALGAEPGHAWMVGDHLEFDVEGSRRVGLRAAWIDRARAGLPAGCAARPDRIIASLRELTDLLA